MVINPPRTSIIFHISQCIPFLYNLMKKSYVYYRFKMIVILNKNVYIKREKNKSIDKLNKSFITQ